MRCVCRSWHSTSLICGGRDRAFWRCNRTTGLKYLCLYLYNIIVLPIQMYIKHVCTKCTRHENKWLGTILSFRFQKIGSLALKQDKTPMHLSNSMLIPVTYYPWRDIYTLSKTCQNKFVNSYVEMRPFDFMCLSIP